MILLSLGSKRDMLVVYGMNVAMGSMSDVLTYLFNPAESNLRFIFWFASFMIDIIVYFS